MGRFGSETFYCSLWHDRPASVNRGPGLRGFELSSIATSGYALCNSERVTGHQETPPLA